MKFTIFLFLAGMLFQTHDALSGESGILVRSDEIRLEPFMDTPSLAKFAKGTKVEILKHEGGWLKVSSQGHEGWVRMLSVRRDGAAKNPLGAEIADAAVWAGARIASTNIIVTTGIRSISRPDSHALILAIGNYPNTHIPVLNGAQEDVQSAKAMARLMNVPESNIVSLDDRMQTHAGINQAFDDLNARVKLNDRVFVYFSGYGSRKGCTESLMTADGQHFTTTEMKAALEKIALKASKVVLFIDTGRAALIASEPIVKPGFRDKYWLGETPPQCAQAKNPLSQGLTNTGTTNYVYIAASEANGVAMEQAEQGGLATQAWINCLSGDARDLDLSGAVSVQELQHCAQNQIDRRMWHEKSGNSQHLAIAGNARFVPSFITAGANMPETTGQPHLDPLKTLQDIYHQRDDKRQVKLSASKPAFRINQDTLDLTLESSESGYVYLIMLGSDKKSFDMLFPNKIDGGNHIQAGEKLFLPRPDWEITPQGPAGKNHVLAIVADSKRDFSLLGMRPMGPFSSIGVNTLNNQDIQIVAGNSTPSASDECRIEMTTQNLRGVRKCSHAFGSAILEIKEID